MARSEVRVELLLGKRVLALNGRSIGRLEEIHAATEGVSVVVTEFLVGSYAVLERLSALMIGRALLRVIGIRKRGGGYRIPWDQLDLSDPERPRLLCKTEDLFPIRD
jgi:sporulation protein YlmC with PRC-barrel domain